MKPIRILQIVTKMDAAGIETFLMNVYRKIDRTKLQFDFLTHRSEKGFFDDEIRELGGKIYNVPPINPLKHKNYLKALNVFFATHKEYKIVHSHINTFSLYPLREALKADVPIRVAHSHIADVPFDLKTPFRIYTKSKLSKYSTHNFACSAMAGKWLYGEDAILKNNFKVINNSIDTAKYSYNKEVRKKLRNELGIEEEFVIGHIGRFNKQKNHEFLIKIFKAVHEKHPTAVLMLVGDGHLRGKFEKQVKDLNLHKNVIFTGVRPDVNELLQVMDVFVFPSFFEGLGIVAVEAQAAGLPCLLSETIPEEAHVTNLAEVLSLKDPIQMWRDKILEHTSRQDRVVTEKQIRANGYDISETSNWLENFYLSSLENIKSN